MRLLYYSTYCYFTLYFYFIRFFSLLPFFYLLKIQNAKPLSGTVASPSSLKAGIASSPLFSLLDLSWSRSVARHAISQVCNCVLPLSSKPLGYEVSDLLSQLWTRSFREPDRKSTRLNSSHSS